MFVFWRRDALLMSGGATPSLCLEARRPRYVWRRDALLMSGGATPSLCLEARRPRRAIVAPPEDGAERKSGKAEIGKLK